MDIPILIDPIEGGRYRARAGEPFTASAEGITPDEALHELELLLLLRHRLGPGRSRTLR